MLLFPLPYLSIYLLYLSSPSLTFLLPLCCHCWCCCCCCRCCFSVSKLSNVADRPWNLSPTKIPSNSSTMLPHRRSHRHSSSIKFPKAYVFSSYISKRQSAEIRAFLQYQLPEYLRGLLQVTQFMEAKRVQGNKKFWTSFDYAIGFAKPNYPI